MKDKGMKLGQVHTRRTRGDDKGKKIRTRGNFKGIKLGQEWRKRE